MADSPATVSSQETACPALIWVVFADFCRKQGSEETGGWIGYKEQHCLVHLRAEFASQRGIVVKMPARSLVLNFMYQLSWALGFPDT